MSEVPVRESKIHDRRNGIPKSVVSASTGIDAIDSAIQDLYKTGYMHNHFRMYVAALCCNVGKCEFQAPGNWLYYHLLDADIASNFASWQWVAGHLTWKTYLADQQNINRYSRTHQENTFLDKPYSELDIMPIPDELSDTVETDFSTNLPETSIPKLSDETILLYTFYNLDPDWHAEKNYNRVLLLEPEHFEKFPVSDSVLEFTLKLAKNIKGISLYTGSFADLKAAYPNHKFIAKEHPILKFQDVEIEERDWIVSEVSGYFQSFSKYYLACLKYMLA